MVCMTCCKHGCKSSTRVFTLIVCLLQALEAASLWLSNLRAYLSLPPTNLTSHINTTLVIEALNDANITATDADIGSYISTASDVDEVLSQAQGRRRYKGRKALNGLKVVVMQPKVCYIARSLL